MTPRLPFHRVTDDTLEPLKGLTEHIGETRVLKM